MSASQVIHAALASSWSGNFVSQASYLAGGSIFPPARTALYLTISRKTSTFRKSGDDPSSLRPGYPYVASQLGLPFLATFLLRSEEASPLQKEGALLSKILALLMSLPHRIEKIVCFRRSSSR